MQKTLNNDLGYQLIAGGAPMRAISPNGVGSIAGAQPVVSLIRFRGHLPKGGYDVQNGIKQSQSTSTTTVL